MTAFPGNGMGGVFYDLEHVSRKSRKLFRPEKPLINLRLAYSVKLIFSYVLKRIKIKITLKFCASRCLCFDDTKRIMSPEKRRQSFGTFEKGAPGQKYTGTLSFSTESNHLVVFLSC